MLSLFYKNPDGHISTPSILASGENVLLANYISLTSFDVRSQNLTAQ